MEAVSADPLWDSSPTVAGQIAGRDQEADARVVLDIAEYVILCYTYSVDAWNA